jgi:hypothetical protein
VTRIPRRMRFSLAAKGTLLLVLTLVFVALLYRGALSDGNAWWVRLLSGIVFAPIAAFLGQTTWLAFADAVVGKAVTVHGAIALASRQSGLSFKLPDGHFAEFVLTNPWESVTPLKRYTLTIGLWSRVVVEPPQLELEQEAQPAPAPPAAP